MIKCKKECLHLRKRLQEERYKVLEDGENWLTIVQAIEAVGKAIVLSQTKPTALAKKRVNGLGDLIEPLQEFVKKHHPTASQEEEDFKDLLEEVRQVRNAEVHTGASARAAAKMATTVGIYLEDTLMAASGAEKNVKAYIQKDVVRAYTWQNLDECRRQMLIHSFSYLPIKVKNRWKMLSDANLAKYLADQNSNELWKQRVECARQKGLKVEPAKEVKQTDSKKCALKKMDGKAAIVTEGKGKNKDLVGIITPFDLL